MSRYAGAHLFANLNGAGDARPTALQIIADENLTSALSDKTFLITGVSSGLGIETMRALHTTGATVYGTVRNMSRGREVVDKILSEAHPGGGRLELVELELDNFASIRRGAADLLARSGGKLNVFVANAGVMTTPEGRTYDGWETQFGTNHLGHFLLFHLVKDALLKSATPEWPSRFVSVTSIGHKFARVNFDDVNFEKEGNEYHPWTAYGQSKTANIWMANAVERHYGASHLHATSVHPGGILEGSNLGQHMKADDPLLHIFNKPEVLRTFKSAEQGAATQVWAAVGEEWKGKGGRYLSDVAESRSYNEIEEQTGGGDMFSNANSGYSEWAYNEEDEERLWRESLRMVGLEG